MTAEDVLIVRCLLDASRKLEQDLHAAGMEDCHSTIFIRNDVYSLLVSGTPDRGKVSLVSLDWSEPDLLREVLLRRLRYNGVGIGMSFEEAWRTICVSHVNGEDSAQYLIDRCLMRPRFLLNLIGHCKSNAVNFGHSRIEQSDIEKGVAAYSTDLIYDIDFEVRDVMPDAEDVLYLFLGQSAQIGSSDLLTMLGAKYGAEMSSKIVEILIWYGVLGVVRVDTDTAYIHTVNYDMKRLIAVLDGIEEAARQFYINPAFWAGLEVSPEPRLI